MIDSLRNTYLPYTTHVPPSLAPQSRATFLPQVRRGRARACTRSHARTHYRLYTYVRACTRVYTDTGTMYGFVARTSNCCAREHRAEGVNVYDKCEIPFRDDYVLLSFGWVTTDPLSPSIHTHTALPLPFL